ncbi:MAG: DUF3365 domain-containing protein [Candidatus Zixiibacteriota bacterium]|nr:MAG: DUF3365 domain-containing protein [candidate division Zixibacteria bacterium]
MRILLILISVVLLMNGCSKESQQADKKSTDLSRADEELLMAASGELIDRFGRQLKAELMAAMNEGGAKNAINVCQVKAPQIAEANSNEFWSIRRISDRNRNPNNTANEHELGILERFNDNTGMAPAFSYEWAPADEGRIYRYYKPIRVAPLCVKCHGSESDLDPEAAETLKEAYPEDRAIGYNPGDLRGMFVVQVRWPQGKAFADSLIALAQ